MDYGEFLSQMLVNAKDSEDPEGVLKSKSDLVTKFPELFKEFAISIYSNAVNTGDTSTKDFVFNMVSIETDFDLKCNMLYISNNIEEIVSYSEQVVSNDLCPEEKIQFLQGLIKSAICYISYQKRPDLLVRLGTLLTLVETKYPTMEM